MNREYSNLRTSYFKKDNKKENSIEKCRKNKFKFDWKSYKPHAPKLLGIKTDYKISVEKMGEGLIQEIRAKKQLNPNFFFKTFVQQHFISFL